MLLESSRYGLGDRDGDLEWDRCLFRGRTGVTERSCRLCSRTGDRESSLLRRAGDGDRDLSLEDVRPSVLKLAPFECSSRLLDGDGVREIDLSILSWSLLGGVTSLFL